MSDASSKSRPPATPSNSSGKSVISAIAWNPWLGVTFVIIMYYVSQLIGGLLVSIYPLSQHWTRAQTAAWLGDSVYAQFIFILLAETLILGALYLFLKRYRSSFKAIGLKRPRWRDLAYGLAAVPAYYAVYIVTVAVASHLIPGLNIDQQQNIGFNDVQGTVPLVLTFVSLVILPPLTEEIMIRGFLYSSLKKAMRILPAALLTSLIFAAAHLPEGGAAGPLYIAALDTFILSLVLVYLREKTGSLWSSITLHTIKNGVAFIALFVLKVH